MSYQCAVTLLYAVTRAQESGPPLVHMFDCHKAPYDPSHPQIVVGRPLRAAGSVLWQERV
jgi:hypothetical protein